LVEVNAARDAHTDLLAEVLPGGRAPTFEVGFVLVFPSLDAGRGTRLDGDEA
jgi:hypothetical protein